MVDNITLLQGKISKTAKNETDKAEAEAKDEKAKTFRLLAPDERKKYELNW